MTCRDVQRWVTGYIDGELDERRSSALRGHLRSCRDCRSCVENEAAIRDEVSQLPPVEPPATLWSGIEAGIAAAESEDAGRSRLWMVWPRLRSAALPAAVVVSAAALFILWLVRDSHTPIAQQQALVSAAPPPATEDDPTWVTENPCENVVTYEQELECEMKWANADVERAIADQQKLLADGNIELTTAKQVEFATLSQQAEQLAKPVKQAVDSRDTDALAQVQWKRFQTLQAGLLGGTR